MKLKPALLLATSAVVFGTLSCASHVNAEDAVPTTAPAADAAPATSPALSLTSINALSYSLGTRVGESVMEARSQGIDLNVDEIRQAIEDVLAKKPAKYTDEQLQTAYREISTIMAAKEEEQRAAQMKAAAADSDKNIAAGKAFRDENAKKAGVTVRESGLQIETLVEGKGESPAPTDTVKVHYTGTLIDGTKFDSSVDRGEPASFPLNRVIKGWTEGVGLMKVGGKSRLVIPPDIAYGAEGSPPVIPPSATLVFEVELLEIVKKDAPATQPGQ
jgi:FKBP-type peptidyl-prolyl cis-trans isomerase FkpA